MIGLDTSLETLAAIASEALERGGVGAVLCGRAVVSIYSHNAYQSHDLDFVTSDGLRRIEAVMTGLGFVRGKGRNFAHPGTAFTVEFPAGPVMIACYCSRRGQRYPAVSQYRSRRGRRTDARAISTISSRPRWTRSRRPASGWMTARSTASSSFADPW